MCAALRIDIVSIFPDYLAPLRLSLVGRAIETGLVRLGVHDLRDWTSDRHRTVDDTPYGGGPGMVMRPEPWGRAIDDLCDPGSRLLIMTPTGRRFTQPLADELSQERHLVLACGRYEGLDARVAAYAQTRVRTDEVSIGDYVLNGGEVAALAVTEAVVRLVPGVIGNPASLAEESHAAGHGGLLEYPLYTKPPSWRGFDAPEILFSGHHAAIEAWRREQALARTRDRRPDLLPPELAEPVIGEAVEADAGELLTLQRAAFVTEAQLNDAPHIPPLTESLAELRASLTRGVVLVARRAGRLVGSVRGEARGDTWYIGRLMVAPDLQGQGIGSRLMDEIELRAPADATTCRLWTGPLSAPNHAFYGRRGYRDIGRHHDPSIPTELVVMEKPAGVGPPR